ncbi:MAG: hypothetical protein ACE5FS_08275 [Paracoccaceae bacterium]
MSDYEAVLLIGTLSGAFAVVRIFSAAVDGRSPRASVLLLFFAIGMFLYAGTLAPTGGMSWRDVPNAVVSLISEFR